MTYVITEACIGTKDRSCVDVCPVDCIHDEGDDDKILYIDPDECIDCGACEPACPVNAIFAEDDVPDNLKAYTEINALWYKGQGPAPAPRSTPSPRSIRATHVQMQAQGPDASSGPLTPWIAGAPACTSRQTLWHSPPAVSRAR